MGTTDEFGNYTFKQNNTEYRITNPEWRDKRVLRGKMSKVLTPAGELDPFSEGFYELQDWVLSKVGYVAGDAVMYLKDSRLVEEHFVALEIDILDGVDMVFNEAIGFLAGNFTSPAAEQSDPATSTADAGDSSSNPSTQAQLSGMLKE